MRLVLDVNSGAVHVVDEPAWFLLRCLSEGRSLAEAVSGALAAGLDPLAVDGATGEIRELAAEGRLLAPDPCGPDYLPPPKPLRALCLHLAHDCNLRCAYCFAGQGRFGGGAALMPPAVGRRAIDYLFSASGAYKEVEVDFFGGEPLLNFPVLRDLVLYARELEAGFGKRVNFTVTTNGLLLNDEVTAFLNAQGLQAVLSLDGRPGVHDRMRSLASGRGSYAEVAPRIKGFVESRDGRNCYVRGTYTRYNTDFTADFRHLAAMGFGTVSLEPVVASPDAPYALGGDDYQVLAAEYERLARGLVAGEYPFSRFFHFELNLDDGPCLAKRVTGCGAGAEYLAVDPGGELYPCHQFVGRGDYRLGNIWTGVTRPDLVSRFHAGHVMNKEDCRACWARFFCGGGCHANNLAATGDMQKPGTLYCLLVRKRIECALILKARAAGAAAV
jgi:uncharacterized protein